ncbi:FAD-binding and (Fe-S)-binding domain-containing protein [Herbaspirillum lusitanum]|uniref:FAD-binding and (Fe-S)-binding domain-containing protein n=1 Tax=Herbaspirillum lusitanum TaxID=213312 RepID=A0ABW9ACY1_9BURK
MSIASISQPAPPPAQPYREFLIALKAAGFEGEISASHAERTVLSTDNSIYQRLPQAAVYPAHAGDVQILANLLAEPAYRAVTLTPRGGGTGTNGQSLSDGVVVDLSRNMNGILEINAAQRWVRVQAGVVKDQLNAALKPYGLFFAPELSTSNRATIGGMINTDASGQGSCVYGKTRDHVQTLDFVLMGGEHLHSRALDADELEQACARPDRIGKVFSTARRISEEQADLIESKFPRLNRCLTGYDLAHLWQPDGHFNLNSLLCGAEGSLGFVVEARLNVLPIPKYSVLVNVRYAAFMDALRDAQTLITHQPLSIETVDSKVLLLAMKDFVWGSVAEYFPQESSRQTLGINLIEFSGDERDAVDTKVAAFLAYLRDDQTVDRLGHTLAEGEAALKRVYAMRKRAVGLLGNVEGEARPQPFVEDTAVPPEQLAGFIAEFRALLDGYKLEYGMFGHVDAGVLHVRPALDMKDPAQAALVRPISDAVAALTQRYGGLLWGEHGKGVRSEYAPQFFGELYPFLQQIKRAFDPYNQFNPGKIATSPLSEQLLLKIDSVPTRGEHDRQIDERVWQSYGAAMHCNGNGACYNFDPDDAMCPSWKATRERVHSPKGRASLMREWLRLQSLAGVNVLELGLGKTRTGAGRWATAVRQLWSRWHNTRDAARGTSDFSHEVYDAMAGCLACKSCAGQCPVKVSVPEFRARFLQLYHQRYLRPLRDYMIGSLEFTIPWFARTGFIYNGIMRQSRVRQFLEKRIGLVDSPMISRIDLAAALKTWQVKPATPEALSALSAAQRARSVVLVQDSFTRFFETEQLETFIELASRLGFQVWLAPLLPNGKPLHVQGFLHAFHKAAIRNAHSLQALAAQDIALVGLDPAMTLVYRQEYLKIDGIGQVPKVALPQEWLLAHLPQSASRPEHGRKHAGNYRLMPHCTERTNAPDSSSQWLGVFQRFGLRLNIEAAGCCGMSGTYGHELRNLDTSRKIYAQSWKARVEQDAAQEGEVLATGYSCRSQVKRLSARQLRHPLQVLLENLR